MAERVTETKGSIVVCGSDAHVEKVYQILKRVTPSSWELRRSMSLTYCDTLVELVVMHKNGKVDQVYSTRWNDHAERWALRIGTKFCPLR